MKKLPDRSFFYYLLVPLLLAHTPGHAGDPIVDQLVGKFNNNLAKVTSLVSDYQTVSHPGGQTVSQTGKIFYKDGKTRIETVNPSSGKTESRIVDMKQPLGGAFGLDGFSFTVLSNDGTTAVLDGAPISGTTGKKNFSFNLANGMITKVVSFGADGKKNSETQMEYVLVGGIYVASMSGSKLVNPDGSTAIEVVTIYSNQKVNISLDENLVPVP